MAAVTGANIVVTDTWTSMGQARDEAKMRALQPYQVTPVVMARASRDAVFLHCLPAHRGEEVVDEVIDGPQSACWDEAENRLHAQKAVLLWAFGKL
jgi:ornithine carbamoyltransferase